MSKSTEHKVYHDRAVEKVYTSSLNKKKMYCRATLLGLLLWFKAVSFLRSTLLAGICKLYTRYQFCCYGDQCARADGFIYFNDCLMF